MHGDMRIDTCTEMCADMGEKETGYRHVCVYVVIAFSLASCVGIVYGHEERRCVYADGGGRMGSHMKSSTYHEKESVGMVAWSESVRFDSKEGWRRRQRPDALDCGTLLGAKG